MRKRTLLTLFCLNVCLGGTYSLLGPSRAAAQEEPFGGGGYDCCKRSNGGANFCCDQCCTDKEGCDVDPDCETAAM